MSTVDNTDGDGDVIAALQARFGVDLADVILEAHAQAGFDLAPLLGANVPQPSIPAELAELMDEIDDGMAVLASDTIWLDGDPAVDPLEFREAVVELWGRHLTGFAELVAPGWRLTIERPA